MHLGIVFNVLTTDKASFRYSYVANFKTCLIKKCLYINLNPQSCDLGSSFKPVAYHHYIKEYSSYVVWNVLMRISVRHFLYRTLGCAI